ncbi:RHS repeat-associated core domain-containing protein [Pseudomonas fulva]|uniref:RHS repeat-associated core domain-containing protein n=1 Tax=Pseudomonas fulva TaxID=47880 RepID=UPI0018AC7610|nr:RHS repeat-associated core domain-containing protein [Pseudomonas fulva]MBF8777182.1 RHS repeat-associated core domain-containing protein [Pseudomonas fulva]
MSKTEKIVKHRFYQGPYFSTELGGSEVYSVFRVQRQLLAQQDAGHTGALATDNGGSILAVDEKDARRAYSYTPYGFRSLRCGKRDPLGFNGELQEYFTNYYMLGNGHRGLHQHVFLSPDGLSPFNRGGINAYAYSSGDPINHIDPSGKFIIFKAAAVFLSTMAGAFSWAAALFTGSRVAQITGGIAVGAGLAAAATPTTSASTSWMLVSASAAAHSIHANVRQGAFNAHMNIFNALRRPGATTPALTGHSTLAVRAAIALPERSREIASTMNFNNINDPAVNAVLQQGPANVRAMMAARRSPDMNAFIGELKKMDTEGLSPETAALIRKT